VNLGAFFGKPELIVKNLVLEKITLDQDADFFASESHEEPRVKVGQ
jgi:hypothetical protein